MSGLPRNCIWVMKNEFGVSERTTLSNMPGCAAQCVKHLESLDFQGFPNTCKVQNLKSQIVTSSFSNGGHP